MLKLTVNGQKKILDKALPLNQALSEWGYHGNTFAVALNTTFVPRSRYPETLLKDGDTIDILAPLSGG
ncbi:MAG: sulfur carrier protein ThiS [Candidatus Competibacteraceae bacterium]